MRCLIGRGGLALVAAVAAALTVLPGAALGARLVGGHEQQVVANAFDALHSKRAIVSIRASTVSPSWVVVRSVAPEASGRTSSGEGTAKLRSSFFHFAGGHARPGTPPHRALVDLAAPVEVAVIYKGSGTETVNYAQLYRSGCAGAGGFIDQQQDTVSPMSWTVRYVVELDNLIEAVQSSQGTTILPTVTFEASGSALDAVEKLTRSYVDQGCFNSPRNFSCSTVYHLASNGADSDLGFDPELGTEIGIPMVGRNTGQCSPEDYTVGPSLWDSGASTVVVPRLGLLGLLGTQLPANPYAPIRVSWPVDSALAQEGFLVSPCEGITASCTDQLKWHGSVQLQPVGRG
ncbi:MAG: hypothetical protein ACLPV4_12465 [Solirubrobacteraceae bacterium]